MTVTITKANFDSEVQNSDKPVLLYFWAPWCPYCVRFAPVLDDISKELPDIKTAKINIDELPDIEAQYDIMTVPALILIKDGEIVYRMAEIKSRAEILQAIKKFIF